MISGAPITAKTARISILKRFDSLLSVPYVLNVKQTCSGNLK